MERPCGTIGNRDVGTYSLLVECLRKRDNMEDIGVDGILLLLLK